jgi:hypothetical protein
VAYVIDPVRDLEGVFAWRGGKPALLPHFWVGDRIITAAASEQSSSDNQESKASAGGPVNDSRTGVEFAAWSPVGWALAAMALLIAFWLGNFFGSGRREWEQRMIIEGAVAHFADAKVIRQGLEEELAAVRARLQLVSDELARLPPPTLQLTKEQTAEAATARKQIAENLSLCTAAIASIAERYGLSAAERNVLMTIAAQKQAELRKQLDALKAPPAAKAAPKTSEKSGGSPPNPGKAPQPTESKASGVMSPSETKSSSSPQTAPRANSTVAPSDTRGSK